MKTYHVAIVLTCLLVLTLSPAAGMPQTIIRDGKDPSITEQLIRTVKETLGNGADTVVQKIKDCYDDTLCMENISAAGRVGIAFASALARVGLGR